MNNPSLRAVADLDDQQLVVQAFESISRTYQNLLDLYAAFGCEPIGMSASLERAHRNNEQMLAVTRHPSKGAQP